MKQLILAIALFTIILFGCSQYFRWNPVLNGLEFEDELLFNTENLGVHLKGFYVVNHSWMGYISFKFKNLSQDTIIITKTNFALTVLNDTIYPNKNSVDTLILPPAKYSDFKILYDCPLNSFKLFNGANLYFPSNMEATLLPVTYNAGKVTSTIPSIGFRPKTRGEQNIKVEFAD